MPGRGQPRQLAVIHLRQSGLEVLLEAGPGLGLGSQPVGLGQGLERRGLVAAAVVDLEEGQGGLLADLPGQILARGQGGAVGFQGRGLVQGGQGADGQRLELPVVGDFCVGPGPGLEGQEVWL
jgi:hypothetical protein